MTVEQFPNRRRELPLRRYAINTKFRWEGHALFVSTGYYADGTLGEVFVSAGKLTSNVDTTAKDAAIAISLALQFGCPPRVLADAFLKKADGTPEGIAGAVMALILKEGLDAYPDDSGNPAESA